MLEPYAEFRSVPPGLEKKREKTVLFLRTWTMEVQDRFAQSPDEDNCGSKKRERRVYS